jgi:tagatose 1,6-diphosphate aldolase
MKQLSIGKWRGLQQCSTARNALAVLALDHRNNLRQALRPDAPQTINDGDLTAFKLEAVAALAPVASAVLLDAQYGAAQCIAAGALPGRCGLLVSVEASGYSGEPTARHSGILPDWSVAKIKRMGASAVKLLVYYHPDSPTALGMESLVPQVAADCAEHDIPLFLETLSYSLDPARKKLPPAELRLVVIEGARRLVVPGVDVLKTEFPADIAAEPDEKDWAKACAELSTACPAPWVLLSASADFETFLRQVTVACQAGASGVAVGRAVWREATGLSGQARADFLHVAARERMARVAALCDALAQPWTEFYAPQAVDPDWYRLYSTCLRPQ